jgi:hypothetical protein
MRRLSSLTALLFAGPVALATARARAEDAPPARSEAAPSEDTVDVVGRHRRRVGPLEATPMDRDPMIVWRRNVLQPFVGANVDVGFAYARPTLQVGWGRPHYMWTGAEGTAQISQNFGAVYLGWRAALPWLEVRTGARFVRPLVHPVQDPKDHYDIRDLETDRGSPSTYTLYEAEALPELRAGPGFVVGAFTAAALRGTPSGKVVFEESLRVMATPPVLLRARLGYLFDVKPLGRARLGAAAEIVGVPGRDAAVVRAGVVMMWRLHEQVDVLVQLLPVVASPDNLGLTGADFSQLGIRYRWATPDVPGPRER